MCFGWTWLGQLNNKMDFHKMEALVVFDDVEYMGWNCFDWTWWGQLNHNVDVLSGTVECMGWVCHRSLKSKGLCFDWIRLDHLNHRIVVSFGYKENDGSWNTDVRLKVVDLLESYLKRCHQKAGDNDR